MTGVEQQWYWDHRTDTALYPCRTDGDTVEFVTVRHADAVSDALDAGALEPLGEGTPDRDIAGTLDFVDSFRLLDDDALSRYVGGE